MPPTITRNDPDDGPWIRIDLQNETSSDEELTTALEQIPSDTKNMNVSIGVDGRNWPRFVGHLATREKLLKVKVVVSGIIRTSTGERRPSDAVLQSYLDAVQNNKAIRVFHFVHCLLFSSAIASFLNEATHLTSFAFSQGEIWAAENDGGPLVLAKALQKHPSLQHLCLRFDQVDYMCPILEALRLNPILKKLTVWMFPNSPQLTLCHLQKLMRSTTSIQELVVHGDHQWTKHDCLKLAKSNFSLQSFTPPRMLDVEWLDDDEERVLHSYFDRNTAVVQFIRNPTTIPKKLLPQTIGVVAQAGNPSILFQSLRAAASTDLFGAAHQRTRKRKRPAYYKPL